MLARRILFAIVAVVAALVFVASISSVGGVAQAAGSNHRGYMTPKGTARPSATATPWAPPFPFPPAVTAEPVIVYEVWGGQARSRLRLSILTNGSVDFSLGNVADKYSYESDGIEEIYHTLALAGAARFFELRSEYGKGNVKGDIHDSITIRQNGRSKTVTVNELGGQGVTPQGLLDMLASLRRVATVAWDYAMLSDDKSLPFPFPAFPAANPGSPAYTITFDLSALGAYGTLQIEHDGKAGLYHSVGRHYGQSIVTTTYITQELMSKLISQINAADFFQLDPRDVLLHQPTTSPSGLDRALYMAIITQGGRSNSITVFEGPPGYLPALAELMHTLRDIFNAQSSSGKTYNHRDELISVWVETCSHESWDMAIDVYGNVFQSFVYVGQLSPTELQDVTDLFLRNRWFDLEDTYSPQTPASNFQCGAIVSFTWQGKSKEIVANEGADVPPALNTILTRLAGIYGGFTQANNIEANILPGMPKAGRSSALDFSWVMLLLVLSSITLGLTLRRLARQ